VLAFVYTYYLTFKERFSNTERKFSILRWRPSETGRQFETKPRNKLTSLDCNQSSTKLTTTHRRRNWLRLIDDAITATSVMQVKKTPIQMLNSDPWKTPTSILRAVIRISPHPRYKAQSL